MTVKFRSITRNICAYQSRLADRQFGQMDTGPDRLLAAVALTGNAGDVKGQAFGVPEAEAKLTVQQLQGLRRTGALCLRDR
jgi:hypothetical protein